MLVQDELRIVHTNSEKRQSPNDLITSQGPCLDKSLEKHPHSFSYSNTSDGSATSIHVKPHIDTGTVHVTDELVVKVNNQTVVDVEQDYDEAGLFASSESGSNLNSDNESLYDETDKPTTGTSDVRSKPNETSANDYDTFNTVTNKKFGENEIDYDTIGAGKTSITRQCGYVSFQQVRGMSGGNVACELDVYNSTTGDKNGATKEENYYDTIGSIKADRRINDSTDRLILHDKAVNSDKAMHKRQMARQSKQSRCSEKIVTDVTSDEISKNRNEKEVRSGVRRSVATIVDDEDEYTFCEIDEAYDKEDVVNEAIYEECLIAEEENKKGSDDRTRDNLKSDFTESTVKTANHGGECDQMKSVNNTDLVYESVDDGNEDEPSEQTKNNDTKAQDNVQGNTPQHNKAKTSTNRRKDDYEEFDLK